MLAMSQPNTRELLAKLAGVFVPISTPFAPDEAVDYDALVFNLGRYAESGVLGYLALGSNGENRSLTEEEKLRVLSTIVRHKGAGQVVLAGATYDAQRDTERFLQQGGHFAHPAADLQCDGILRRHGIRGAGGAARGAHGNRRHEGERLERH